MRLFAGSSEQFIQDSTRNEIATKLRSAFFDYYRYNPSPAEINSWRNSLKEISNVFVEADLTDHGVILEYQLPLTSKRLDCLISGKDKNDNDNAIIIELKQWSKCREASGDNEVLTWVGGDEREVLHPSVQVAQYTMYLQDTHTAFYADENPVFLNSCTYLHNYSYDSEDVIFSDKFSEIIKDYPLFTADNTDGLKGFLLTKLENGDGLEVLQKIENGKYKPSKKLMDHVGNLIKGKPEYTLLDEQLVVFDKVLSCVKNSFFDDQKKVVIVKGGPGTGKSVIAINLMSSLLLDGYNAQYATGSRAFTETLRKIVGMRGSAQFKYFNSYMNEEQNSLDVLIADEAHRIRKTSNNRYTPRERKSEIPQIEELIDVAKVLVLFIDDDQIVRPDEIGSVEFIKAYAKKNNCQIFEYELEAQFRCNGSDGFVNWINNTLGIQKTANIIWTQQEEFDFKIMSSPEELEASIIEKMNDGFNGRLTAGFCWPWSQPNRDGTLVDDVTIGDFTRPWNAKQDATKLAKGIPKASLWAYDLNGVNQIGCIYTIQGFEFDYVGVVFGKDLVYNFDTQRWEGHPEYSEDSVVKRSKDQFTDLVKNTYRVLLSRGMKGCYVYFMDKDTENFFKSRIEY
ncbi:DUF2075 domain-containing protein [Methanosarcina sp.]|uniref:DUF2075 domain-containing protein n=1 Tax=Methanosarcina sp. TaxID=2213 RepID=UPI002AB9FF2E|nr:DUF2075 domain-containing protein [Methanosarcina sp.]MDY9924879.1 DUF2075 domain-containing protein [Methanosarcina sp.]